MKHTNRDAITLKMVRLFLTTADMAEDTRDTDHLRMSLQTAHLPVQHAMRVLSRIEARERAFRRATTNTPART